MWWPSGNGDRRQQDGARRPPPVNIFRAAVGWLRLVDRLISDLRVLPGGRASHPQQVTRCDQ
jgi:hypothetical protein